MSENQDPDDVVSTEEHTMPMLSTGQPSTLANWHALCVSFFGEKSPATEFIKAKLDEQGPNMAVLSDERQLLFALLSMANK